jgi:hypothetical protein
MRWFEGRDEKGVKVCKDNRLEYNWVFLTESDLSMLRYRCFRITKRVLCNSIPISHMITPSSKQPTSMKIFPL